MQALREKIGGLLPEHMVPSVITPIDTLPLTSGKLDRNALPVPKQVLREAAGALAPRDDLESELCQLWGDLLGLEGIGITDDFFVLGGDSLQATRLIVDVARRYGVRVDPETFLSQGNTIAGLAGHLRSSAANKIAKPDDELDVDFAEFEVGQNSDLYHIDPATALRRARPRARWRNLSFNSLGFRGPEIVVPKPASRIRLAFLGDSLTLDPKAPTAEDAWPHLTCRYLGERNPHQEFDYVNAALPAQSTAQMKALFDAAIAPLEPDVICLQASDMVRDAAFAARAAGVFDGVHHRQTWLAKRSPGWRKLEMNGLIALRLCSAHRERGKLQADPTEITAGFDERLQSLVETCAKQVPVILMIASGGKLRREQSRLYQLRAAETNVYYLPYLSLHGVLELYESYARVVLAKARTIGAPAVDVTAVVPGDDQHFVDSDHLSPAGSRLLASAVAAALDGHRRFRALLSA